MEVPGKRMRGRPKRMWLDNIRNDLSENELSGEEVHYPSSMEATHVKRRHHIKVGKGAEEEEYEFMVAEDEERCLLDNRGSGGYIKTDYKLLTCRSPKHIQFSNVANI